MIKGQKRKRLDLQFEGEENLRKERDIGRKADSKDIHPNKKKTSPTSISTITNQRNQRKQMLVE
jgi:hypothetical protein